MRPLLKYGVPAAAGLAAGGYALSQGEDPGSAALAGLAGGAGARGGLLAGRLAGKYAPAVAELIQSRALTPAGNALGNLARSLPDEAVQGKRMAAINKVASGLEAAEQGIASPGMGRAVQSVSAGLAAPGAAGLAGLGGIAAGAIPGALGVPGFQQGMPVDPESYGSSNSAGARYKTPTTQYV
jgi:hypothetical protein